MTGSSGGDSAFGQMLAQSVQDVVVLRCGDHASLAHILGSYVERMARSHPGMALREAVVAIAGYLQGDRLVNANLPWEVSVARTADAARLESLVLINDFGAVAHAIPGVQRQTLVPLLPGQRDPGMQVPALVLGPGTGLGAAMCLDRAGAEVLLTESGHAALAAGNPLELAVLPLGSTGSSTCSRPCARSACSISEAGKPSGTRPELKCPRNRASISAA